MIDEKEITELFRERLALKKQIVYTEGRIEGDSTSTSPVMLSASGIHRCNCVKEGLNDPLSCDLYSYKFTFRCIVTDKWG
jgi:hypothetical protein